MPARPPQAARLLVPLALLAMCTSSAAEGPGPAPRTCAALLDSDPLVANPTRDAVTLSVLPAATASFSVQLDADAGPPLRTPWQAGHPGKAVEFRLAGLEAGGSYRYRLHCRSAEGELAPEPARSFRTLRPPGQTVRLAFVSDSHAYRIWARAELLADPVDVRAVRTLEQTVANVAAADVDFMIAGGDESMTHCVKCPAGVVDGRTLAGGSARTLEEAEFRYRVMRRFLGRAATPFLLVLGNHDGEAGFSDAEGRCGHFDATRRYSRRARQQLLPNPARAYSGNPLGTYFAFTSGNALFVVLDVMSFTPELPSRAEDWTLGADQLAWLEATLGKSRQTWKFLFAHHLVGGGSGSACYQYGRGGVRATVDGTARGRFLGEQDRIHALMRRHGAQFFVYGHDHVFALGEKLDESGDGDGTYYIVGGQGSGTNSNWVGRSWFDELYDHDEDGSADYLTNSGFLKIEVDGERAVRLEFIASDPDDGQRNGRRLFGRVIER